MLGRERVSDDSVKVDFESGRRGRGPFFHQNFELLLPSSMVLQSDFLDGFWKGNSISGDVLM
jgi:hypothetical protein